jgi:glycogen operon protein
MIRLRRRHKSLRRRRFLAGSAKDGHPLPDIRWYAADGSAPDWSNPEARALAYLLAPQEPGEAPLYVMVNMHASPMTMRVTALAGRRWHRAVDTSLPAPQDIAEPETQQLLGDGRYRLAARSVVVLESRLAAPAG